MAGAVAGVALANRAVMNPGGTDRDEDGEVGEQSCVGAISWPSKVAGAEVTPSSWNGEAEASDAFGENGDAGRTDEGEDCPVGPPFFSLGFANSKLSTQIPHKSNTYSLMN
jgi:hypothetical protein